MINIGKVGSQVIGMKLERKKEKYAVSFMFKILPNIKFITVLKGEGAPPRCLIIDHTLFVFIRKTRREKDWSN
jgi:hypothetical protein